MRFTSLLLLFLLGACKPQGLVVSLAEWPQEAMWLHMVVTVNGSGSPPQKFPQGQTEIPVGLFTGSPTVGVQLTAFDANDCRIAGITFLTSETEGKVIEVTLQSLPKGATCPGERRLCDADCDTLRVCDYQDESQTRDCHTACQNQADSFTEHDLQVTRDCKNAESIREQQLTCFSSQACGMSVNDYGFETSACMSRALGSCLR